MSPQPRLSTDEPRELPPRSSSVDSQLRPSSPLSSGQLAESALVNLRKSLASQRSGSPASPKSTGTREHRLPKSTLEDRLRAAAFAIGEASNPSSAVASARVSPTPSNPASQRPLSPLSTPLPESPKNSLEIETTVPLTHSALSPVTTSAVEPKLSSPRRSMSTETSVPTSESTHLPQASQSSDATDSTRDLPDAAPEMLYIHSGPTDVEGLQERLKQVEQRFTGMYCSPKIEYPTLFLLQMFQLLLRNCKPRRLLLIWLYVS